MRLSPALLLAAATLAGTAAAPRACAAPVAYVTNSADGTVSVLDTITNTITATVPVGSDPFGVAVDPSGIVERTAFVSTSTIETLPSPEFATYATGAADAGRAAAIMVATVAATMIARISARRTVSSV